MTRWDFCADVDALVKVAATGSGPRSMADMFAAAEGMVAKLTAENPDVLYEWLSANATFLVAQQILATSVHADGAAGQVPALLSAWTREQTEQPTSAAAVGWLREQHPAQLRAWLLEHVETLVGDELAAVCRCLCRLFTERPPSPPAS